MRIAVGISSDRKHPLVHGSIALPLLVSVVICALVGLTGLTSVVSSQGSPVTPEASFGTTAFHSGASSIASHPASATPFRSHPAIRTAIPGSQTTVRAGGYYSTNWGGDIACANSGCGGSSASSGITAVEASWQVSAVASTSTSMEMAATWVGIGGWGSSDLVQAGLDAEVLPSGATYYGMWWEMLPASSTGVFLSPNPTISPGDQVFADVIYQGVDSGGNQLWQFTVGDRTTSSEWQGTEGCGSGCTQSSFSTAEWIQETPEVGSAFVQMPAFSSFAFVNPQFYTGGVGWSYLSSSTPNLNWAWQRNTAFTSEATVIPSVLYPLPNVLYMDYVVSTHNGPSVICCSISSTSGEPRQLMSGGVNLSSPDSFGSSSSSNLGVDLVLANTSGGVCKDRADGVIGLSINVGLGSYSVPFRACQGTPYGTYYLHAEVWYVPVGGTIGGSGSLLLSTIGGTGSIPQFTVFGPSDTRPTGSPGSGQVDSGQNATFTTTASGGSAPYSFVWNGLPASCPTKNASTLTCVGIASGTYGISVTVTDSVGAAFASPSLTFKVEPDPTVSTPIANHASSDAGQNVTFSTNLSGGTGVYTISWTGLPTYGCTGTVSSVVTCSSLPETSLAIQVSVSDSAGMTDTSGALTYVVHSDPTISPVSASRSTPDVGQAVAFSVTSAGGSGGNTFSWSGLPSGCVATATPTVTCTPSGGGGYLISASVTDSNGFTVTSQVLSFLVYSDPTVSSFTASPGSFLEGSSTTFLAAVTGGSAPFTYSFVGLPGGCSSANVSSFACTPSATGTFIVEVIIYDANGMETTQNATLTVNPEMLGLPATEGYAVISGLVALAAAVVVLGVLLASSRRKRRNSKSAALAQQTSPPLGAM